MHQQQLKFRTRVAGSSVEQNRLKYTFGCCEALQLSCVEDLEEQASRASR